MYAAHFGLGQDPFSIAPDPRYLFMSERHREALAHLLFGLDAGGGVVLLSGDIGTGKTTVCRCFLEQVPERVQVAYIFNPKLSVTELLRSICDEFHVPLHAAGAEPTIKECIDPLNAFLLASHAAGRNCVLVIDEAQNLSAEVLEQLRLLTNLETSERKLLQIILIGQPELRDLLARPDLEQLAQRVVARFHLQALDAGETRAYIAHRLAVAGHHGALPFDDAALRRIHRLSAGVPRRINLLCGRALLGAYAEGRSQVDRRTVDRAAHEVFGEERKPAMASRDRSAGPAPGGWRWFVAGSASALAVAASSVLLWERLGPGGATGAPGLAASASHAIAVHRAASAAPGLRAASAVAGSASLAGTAGTAGSASAGPASAPRLALADLGAAWPRDERPAWRELARQMNIAVPAEDPCAEGPAGSARCHRAVAMGLALVRQLGRPGVLYLLGPDGKQRHAVLIGLGSQDALLATPDGPRRVALLELASAWRGDFGTYWTPPAGYAGSPRDGDGGAYVDGIARALARAAGEATPLAPARWDGALRGRLEAFQRAQGLRPDGVPGPLTLMQLAQAAGQTGPRLITLP